MKKILKKFYWKIKGVLNKINEGKTKIATVKSGYAKGVRLLIPVNTPRIYKKMIEGNYEEYIAEKLLKKTDMQGRIVWDVGAHFGYQSFVFSRLVGENGKVISFEPNPSNVRTFEENLKNNLGLEKNIFLQQKGLSSKKDVLSFNVSKKENASETSGGYLSNITPPFSKSLYKNFTEIKVNVDTIDDLIHKEDLPSPDIIKMDIEGGELDALKGGLNTLKTKKPILVVEIHSELLFDQIKNLLSEVGYEIEEIDKAENTTTIIAN